LKRRPKGRRFTRTAAARNVSNVTIRVFGKGANRCAGSAAAGYVLVTQTFPQAHKQHHSSEPCYQYPEPPRRYIAAIGTGGAPAPRLPLFLEARATTQAAYRDLRPCLHVRTDRRRREFEGRRLLSFRETVFAPLVPRSVPSSRQLSHDTKPFNSLHQNLLVDPAAKYLDGTPPRLGNSVLTLIKDILINIVNQSITLSKETDFVFDFLSENIKTTGCADRSAGANCIS
jgi:hypothetical protein